MKTSNNFLILILVLLFSSLNIAEAQHRYENAVSIGMGGTGTTFIGDYNANFINPANLMLRDRSKGVVISFGDLSGGIGGPLVDINTYNRFLTNDLILDRALQSDMLDSWVGSSNDPGKIHYGGVQFAVVPFAASARLENHAFSAAFRARFLAKSGVSRGFMEVGFGGFDSETFSESREVNANMSLTAFSELSFGYATLLYETSKGPFLELPFRLYAGVAPKILMGATTTNFSIKSDLLVSGDSLIVHNFDYALSTFGNFSDNLDRYLSDRQSMDEFPSLSDYLDAPDDIVGVNATGFGIDIGLTAEIDLPFNSFQGSFFGAGKRFIRVAMSVSDIGSMSFKSNAAVFRNQNQLRWGGLFIDQDRLRDEYDSNLGDYFTEVLTDSIGNDLYLNFQKESRDKISASLPAQFNFGMQLTAGKFTTVLDLSSGFNNEGVNSKLMALGFGVEYLLGGVVPLRTGFNTGGRNAASWTFGTGLQTRHYDFNIGVMFVGNSQSSGAWLAAGLSAFTFRF
jgi:hypothetical protein